MPSYTFRSAGTTSTAGSPGDPAGKTSGDLLLMKAAARAATETFNGAPTGWTLLKDTSTTTKEQLALMARIATGDANDTVTSYDFWSGTSNNLTQIAAFSGDVYTDLATIVAHSVVAGSTDDTADLPYSALTITTDNCLVVSLGQKTKTATSDGATLTDPSELGTRINYTITNGTTQYHIWNYSQQTTATNIAGGIWDQSIEESKNYASIVVALKTAAAGALIAKSLLRPFAVIRASNY